MFGISFSEILLIIILGVIIFGPEQLPQIAKFLGKWFFAIQNSLSKLRNDIYNQTGLTELVQARYDLDKIYNEVKNTVISERYQQNTINHNSNSNDDNKNVIEYYEYIYYQPELDFERQPELFDL